MSPGRMTDDLMMSRQLLEEIRQAEEDVQTSTRRLAGMYAKLVAECGGFRPAARLAKEAGLKYANAGSLTRLVYWSEFLDALEMEGVDRGQHPSERQIRRVLNDHYWTVAGPGGLAEVWVKNPNVKDFLAACEREWPKPLQKPRPLREYDSLIKEVRVARKSGMGDLLKVMAVALGSDGLAEFEKFLADHRPIKL